MGVFVEEDCAVCSSVLHLVLKLCENWPQFVVTFAREKTKWRFLSTTS